MHQWREELFRAKFKMQSSEAKDTSVFRKLKQDIARALTIISEKGRGVVIEAKQDQPVKVKAKAAPVEAPVPQDQEAQKVEKKKPARKKSEGKGVKNG